MNARAVTTIDPGLPFVDSLAGYVLAACDHDPLALAQATILLPNRRACRSLRDAFLRLSQGRPLLLPRLRAMDAVDEDEVSLASPTPLDIPPAIDDYERRLLLAKLVIALGSGRGGHSPSADQALRLAAELAKLLDAVQIERLNFDQLDRLAPDALSAHWQITLEFLTIVTRIWPAILAERGVLDRQDRINRLIDAQADLWRRTPPDHLVIAAGSTGSRPATADLMAVIATLPRGLIVLPGLDLHMDDDGWSKLEDSHPQWGLRRLLDHLGITRRQVRPLVPQPDVRAARSALLREALRPAETCELWRSLPPLPAATLADVGLLLAPSPREEAGAIALILRQALEVDGQTAALVTPDRTLAHRVAAELERWGLVIDDSAGTPLDSCESGTFLRLIAAMVADDFAPQSLLACLKHRLAAGGMDAAHFRRRVERLEKSVLRGPRPAAGLTGIRRLLPADDQDLAPWLDDLQALTQPLCDAMHTPQAGLPALVAAHLEVAQALAATDQHSGSDRLWRGETGDALSTLMGNLLQSAHRVGSDFPPFDGKRYPAVLDEFLSGAVARQAWGSHPRLFLWGSMEARLQQADVMVLAGLNEGTWPQSPGADPWMSRPMRKAFGLPSPEWGIGQSAHDFAQAFAAPRVILSRSLRVDGTPTVPSRWLMRLQTVMQALGLDFGQITDHWLDWHQQLDRPDQVQRIAPPAPRPPLAARPRRLSVTDIELWRRDPYGLYAKRILNLKALKPIDADPGAADYGTLVHDCIDRFYKAYPRHLPDQAEQRLLDLGAEVFAPLRSRPGLWAFWWPRFQSVARWLIAHERGRRHLVAETLGEIQGELEIAAPAGPFLLQARADRIDRMQDGSLTIIDYKTGQPPSPKEVAAGYAPQLPLEGLIAAQGGFRDLPAAPVDQLLFWRLKGGAEGGEEKSAGPDGAELARQALQGLAGLVAAFDDETTPYEARPHPDFAPKYSDYQHLARHKEWLTGDDGDGE